MLGVSRTTLWRMVQAGLFPQPVVISRRATGHLLHDVEQWMKSRGDRVAGKGPVAAAAIPTEPTIRRPITGAARRRRGRG
jgi:hypothetical protein